MGGVLERKCAKLRQRADQEERRRLAAESKLEACIAELEDLRPRLAEREQQVVELCASQRDLVEDQRAAEAASAALHAVQRERDEAYRALQDCRLELKQQAEEAAIGGT